MSSARRGSAASSAPVITRMCSVRGIVRERPVVGDRADVEAHPLVVADVGVGLELAVGAPACGCAGRAFSQTPSTSNGFPSVIGRFLSDPSAGRRRPGGGRYRARRTAHKRQRALTATARRLDADARRRTRPNGWCRCSTCSVRAPDGLGVSDVARDAAGPSVDRVPAPRDAGRQRRRRARPATSALPAGRADRGARRDRGGAAAGREPGPAGAGAALRHDVGDREPLDPGRHHVVYVDQVTPAQTVVMASWVGRRSPVHASSSGKVLLAFGDPTHARGRPARAARVDHRTHDHRPRWTPCRARSDPASRLRGQHRRARGSGW